MIKNKVIDTIVCSMMGMLKDEQLKRLKDELYMKLSDYDLVRKETELVVYDNSDFALIEKFCIFKHYEKCCSILSKHLRYAVIKLVFN